MFQLPLTSTVHRRRVQDDCTPGADSGEGCSPGVDSPTIRQVFSRYGKTTLVGETVHGFVVTFENAAAALTAASQERESLQLDGQPLEVWLLRPDVHGCEVTVTSGHLAIYVGRRVLTKVIEDKKCRDHFDLKLSNFCTAKFWWTLPGQIGVTCSSSRDLVGWELDVLTVMRDLLLPFQPWLEDRAEQASIWERVLDPDSPRGGWDDNFTDVTIPFSVLDEFKFRFFTEEKYRLRLFHTFPQLEASFSTADKTVSLQGPGSTVDKALTQLSKDHERLSRKHFQITEALEIVWTKPGFQTWLEATLERENIICSWKEAWSFATRIFDNRRTFLITAFDSDHPKIERIFKYSFVKTKLRVPSRQIHLLETDAFKSTLKRAVKDKEPSPELLISPTIDTVTIIDRPVRIEATRRVIITFLYNQLMGRNSFLCAKPMEESISDLKPYQVQFLSIPHVMQLLSQDLTHTVFLDSDAAAVFVRAPIDRVDKCVIHVLKYIATISQESIVLTPATAAMYTQQAAVRHVQNELDKQRLLCHWQVEKGRLVASAQEADHDDLKRVFLTVFKETKIRVPGSKRCLLLSRDWQNLAAELQKAEEGCLAPVLRWTKSGDIIAVVDMPENMHKTREAVYKFFASRDGHLPPAAIGTLQSQNSAEVPASLHSEQGSATGEKKSNGADKQQPDNPDSTRQNTKQADCNCQTFLKAALPSQSEAEGVLSEDLGDWEEQLCRLTVDQLLELCARLGVCQRDTDSVMAGCQDDSAIKRSLTARCLQYGNISSLCTALLTILTDATHSLSGLASAQENEPSHARLPIEDISLEENDPPTVLSGETTPFETFHFRPVTGGINPGVTDPPTPLSGECMPLKLPTPGLVILTQEGATRHPLSEQGNGL